MRRISGNNLATLTSGELGRIHRTLVQRYRGFDKGNVLGIAFGAKRTKRRRDTNQGITVRFLVKKKRNPRSKSRRLPTEVFVRFRPDGSRKFAEAIFPTDIEELKPITPTGVRIIGPSDAATTGMVFKVRLPGTSSFRWCMLSVGHIFENDSIPISTLTKGRLRTGSDVVGLMLRRTKPPGRFDAAIAEASLDDLKNGNLVFPPPTPLLLRSELALQNDATEHTAGVILRRNDHGGDAILKTLDYAPELPVGPLGTLRSVIRAEARQSGVFKDGTSGSIWLIGNGQNLAGIQVAAEQDGRVGYAQALFATMNDWVFRQYDDFPIPVNVF